VIRVPHFAGSVSVINSRQSAYSPSVDKTEQTEPAWVAPVCCTPRDLRGDETIVGLFRRASPDLSERDLFVAAVSRYLARHLELLEMWQGYSADKRTPSGPYIIGNEVGYFYKQRKDVQVYERPVDACADFIYREANWVLENERATD
jgi:hypothetical protein